MSETITIYTNANDRYDYESTVLSSEEVPYVYRLGMNSRSPFRRVVLDNREHGYYATYQCSRYRSGAYMVMNQTQWDREINDGYIVPMEDTDATAT